MPLYQIESFAPSLNEGVFVAPSADVIGRVILHKDSSVWFGCVLRGDINEIVIGEGSNIQDNSTLHVVEAHPCHVGKGVTVGHNVILHACTVEDHCLIGMGATVLDGAIIKEGSLVAAGSVVTPGSTFPPNSFIVGTPAKAVRMLREGEKEVYHNHFKTYLKAKDSFNKTLKQI
ncbi:MAG: gamma carbonic anhydrase family protein [Halobacteriovoraceae bacterium]|nr:gamma carbonic anhydrase family protein [Halobacteriovoraceae bacterium]